MKFARITTFIFIFTNICVPLQHSSAQNTAQTSNDTQTQELVSEQAQPETVETETTETETTETETTETEPTEATETTPHKQQ